MNNVENIEHLYALDPAKKQLDVDRLADIMGIPHEDVANASDLVLITLCGTILLPHLDEYNKTMVMRDIDNLRYEKRMALYTDLQFKIGDGLINPDWVPWSMTTKELEDRMKSDEKAKKYFDKLKYLGFGFDLKGGYDGYEKFRGGVLNKSGAISLFIGGMLELLSYWNDEENEIINSELKRRTPKPRY